MTIFIDVLNNAILFLKGNAPLYKKEYDYSLSILDNKVTDMQSVLDLKVGSDTVNDLIVNATAKIGEKLV